MKKLRAMLIVTTMTLCMFSLTACGSEVKKDLEEDIDTLTEEADEKEKEGESDKEAEEDIQGDIDKDAEGLLDDMDGDKDK